MRTPALANISASVINGDLPASFLSLRLTANADVQERVDGIFRGCAQGCCGLCSKQAAGFCLEIRSHLVLLRRERCCSERCGGFAAPVRRLMLRLQPRLTSKTFSERTLIISLSRCSIKTQRFRTSRCFPCKDG